MRQFTINGLARSAFLSYNIQNLPTLTVEKKKDKDKDKKGSKSKKKKECCEKYKKGKRCKNCPLA